MKQYAGLIALGALALSAFVFTRQSDEPKPAPAQRQLNQDNQASRETQKSRSSQGDFDFYVLALSWSPSFCASNEGKRSRQQCGTSQKFGFVVHGLWPQNHNGFPQFCTSSEPERVPSRIGDDLADIMPSMGLIGHQWRKHGTCSNLSQEDYFSMTRQAFDRIEIPNDFNTMQRQITTNADAIEKAFLESNPQMSPQGIAVTCDEGRIEEVRICLSKDLEFQQCPEVDRRSCRAKSSTLPAINP